MGVLEELRRAVADAYGESPTGTVDIITRTLRDVADVRGIYVVLHQGSPYPQVVATVRLNDVQEPVVAQVVATVLQLLGMPSSYVAGTAAAAARGAMLWIQNYRRQASAGGRR